MNNNLSQVDLNLHETKRLITVKYWIISKINYITKTFHQMSQANCYHLNYTEHNLKKGKSTPTK